MKRGLVVLSVAGLLFAPSIALGELLVNGGFETGDLTGWNVGSGDISVDVPGVGAFEGSHALRMNEPANGVPTVDQGSYDSGFVIPASPGQEFNLSGYALTETALPAGPFGLFKMVFEDALGNDLIPQSVSIGQLNSSFPGAESLPFLNDASPVNEWIFSETQAVAPAGTVSVHFLALVVDFAGGNHPMYFDSVSATLIPEPSSLLLFAGLAGAALYRRR